MWDSWFSDHADELHFDLGFDRTFPTSFEPEVYYTDVYPLFEYSVFVSTESWVFALGWPGSLAGSMMSVAVPSITFEFNPLVIQR